MDALYSNSTWDLVTLSPSKSPIGCCREYIVKLGTGGQVDRFKADLVAKGYTQQCGSNYYDTFSPMAKIVYVRLFHSMVDVRSWPLFQFDIKNAL